MSNPSFSNIDRWLFELTEGNLSETQIAQLELFLMQHPELDVDRDMWELSSVKSEPVVYPHQQNLQKRRPVGLYMSLGFASIVTLISIGLVNVFHTSLVSDTQFLTEIVANGHSNQNAFSNSNNGGSNSLQQSNYLTNSNSNHFNSLQNSLTGFKTANTIQTGFAAVGLTPISNSNLSIGIDEPTYIASNSNSNITENKQTELIPSQVKTVDSKIKASQFGIPVPRADVSKRFAKTNYKMSFGSRLNHLGRSVQRMMDNPVALKNTKDPYYHVPGMQAMDVNFSSVGSLLALRVQTVTRAQWLGEKNQQFTNQLSIDGYSYGMRGGVGFQFNQNYYGNGEIVNYNAAVTYSPKFSIARNVSVEPSVRFKMGNKFINSNQIETGTVLEYDRMNGQTFNANAVNPIGHSLWYKDLGLGLLVNTKWFYVGVQGDNLMRHYDNIYSNDSGDPRRVGKHFVGTIGTDYQSKKEHLTISPYFVYQQQEKLSEAWLGTNIRFHWLTIGGAISSNLEPAVSLGLKFDRMMITYNADYTQSQFLNAAQLSHQVTLRILTKPSRVSHRLLNY